MIMAADIKKVMQNITNEVYFNRLKQEGLSDLKDEAFSLDIIRQTDPSDPLFHLLRRARTKLEVYAYSTIIIQQNLNRVCDY